ncbi:hypothetical protein JXL83_00335 [candidate division WOR-3 bacterium]|nr:hypothetical protein [candidate division WOR-3 bacterium]
MVKTMLAEQLFMIGEIALVLALIIYGLILKRLLKLLKKSPIFWIMLIVSGLFVLMSLVFHAIGVYEKGSVEDPVELMRTLGMMGLLEVAAIFVGSVMAIFSGVLYNRWSHR